MAAKTLETSMADVLGRLDRLAMEVAAVREQISRLSTARSLPAPVSEWVRRVNAAIDDQTLDDEKRQAIIKSVPPPLRHVVAAECYRTNESVTFGWVAEIAGILTFEVPDLLRAQGVEPEFTSETSEEMDEEIAALNVRGALRFGFDSIRRY